MPAIRMVVLFVLCFLVVVFFASILTGSGLDATSVLLLAFIAAVGTFLLTRFTRHRADP